MEKRKKVIEELKIALDAVNGINKYGITIDEDGDILINTSIEIDVNEKITNVSEAVYYLKEEGDNRLNSIVTPVFKENITKVEALDKLLILARAWNKADNFTMSYDLSRSNAYTPTFTLDGDKIRLVVFTFETDKLERPSELYFKTPRRAMQFGKQFIDLWNEYLLG